MTPPLRQALAEFRKAAQAQYDASKALCHAMEIVAGIVSEEAEKRAIKEAMAPSRKILLEVSKKTGVPAGTITGPMRTKPVIRARHIAMTIIRRCTKMSLTEIGAMFGRDHTTVMGALKGVNRRRCPEDWTIIRSIEAQLGLHPWRQPTSSPRSPDT